MHKVERRGVVQFDDLMREIEEFEQDLLGENPTMAMNLMVLEAKIRERFQQMENRIWDQYATFNPETEKGAEKEISLSEIEAMIPRDLVLFPSEEEFADGRRRKRAFQTVGLAAVLAVLTAVGVFGLASLLQFALSLLV